MPTSTSKQAPSRPRRRRPAVPPPAFYTAEDLARARDCLPASIHRALHRARVEADTNGGTWPAGAIPRPDVDGSGGRSLRWRSDRDDVLDWMAAGRKSPRAASDVA